MSRSSPPRRQRSSAASTREVDLGPFVLSFGLVLVVGALGLVGWWLAHRGAPDAIGTGGMAATQLGATATGEAGAVVLDPRADGWTSPEGDQGAGDPSAPITVISYSDFQCPNCRQFATDVLPWLRRTWMANGMVKLIHRDFTIFGDASVAAAEAAHCAGEQGRFWAFHDALFTSAGTSGAFDRASLLALATQSGLDASALAGCLDSGRQSARVAVTTADGHAQGFAGTPTYLIDGRKTDGAIAVADWDALFRIYATELGWPTPPVAP